MRKRTMDKLLDITRELQESGTSEGRAVGELLESVIQSERGHLNRFDLLHAVLDELEAWTAEFRKRMEALDPKARRP